MISMFSYGRKNAGSRSGVRRAWAVLPALALGAFVALVPTESQAAPTCSSKPAVCDRLAATKKQSAPALVVQAQATQPVARNVAASPTCATKPSVCARLDARDVRPAATPVTLASNAAGARCSSKPAVCARLRVRPTAEPFTLATTAGEAR